MKYFFCFCLAFLFSFTAKVVFAKDYERSALCKEFEFRGIPIGNFFAPYQMPIRDMRITQKYNNERSEGWCEDENKKQYPASNSICANRKIYFGHDGIDLNPIGAIRGKEPIYAVQNALVVASISTNKVAGWGESIVLAVRANAYSDEILTFNYHHMHATGKDETYFTTRKVFACDLVTRGQVLAYEGGTPSWPVHLHFSIRRWANMGELLKAVKTSTSELFGPGYAYENTEKLKNNLNPETFFLSGYTDSSRDALGGSAASWLFAFGIDFGLFNGEFGFKKQATRGEIARILKVANRVRTYYPQKKTFNDLEQNHSAYYPVESLVRYPEYMPAIDPQRSCSFSSHNFCPDTTSVRAEFLKMAIISTREQDYYRFYDETHWKGYGTSLLEMLGLVKKEEEKPWYHTYLQYSFVKGLSTEWEIQNPQAIVTKEEVAKWIYSALNPEPEVISLCREMNCPVKNYCDPVLQRCIPIPTCVPYDGNACPFGGIRFPDDDISLIPTTGGTGGISGGSPSEQPISSGGGTPPTNDYCQCSQGVCCHECRFSNSNRLCHEANRYRCTVSNAGTALEYSFEQVFCSGFDSICNGLFLSGDWRVVKTCGANEECRIEGSVQDCFYRYEYGSGGISSGENYGISGGSGGTGAQEIGTGGQKSCEKKFTIQAQGNCYSSGKTSTSPTLCLEVRRESGRFEQRICKQGDVFHNAFRYQIFDHNHSDYDLVEYFGEAGVVCSPWRGINLNHVDKSGPSNGAGLIGYVYSPENCQSLDCTYKTGYVTVYFECL